MFGEDSDNTPFTEDERAALAEELRNAAVSTKETYSLSNGQFAALSAQVEYLLKASERTGRLDWKNIFVGTMFNYLVGAGLTSGRAGSLFAMATTAIARVYGHDLPALPF